MHMMSGLFQMISMMAAMITLLIVSSSAFEFPSASSSLLLRYTPLHASSSLFSIANDEEREQVGRAQTTQTLSIVERCYSAWNRRDMKDSAACFANEFAYDDGQFLGVITNNKSELESRFKGGADILPPKSTLIVDSIAVCPTTNNIGTRWHAEKEDGTLVPLTRGCSFYTVDPDSGLIKTGFKVSEMVIKPSKDIANNLVSSASKLMETSEGSDDLSLSSDEEKSTASSIIEKYFQAWNKRDMESALDCFVDDCVYETEDPVFVDTFRGKDALREHLVKNSAALPSACQIILDDLAIDIMRGTFGVKWHLEVSGISIPNLRGCSMYTMDCDVGLLKSGFDVTESPVKFPGVAQKLFAAIPSNILQSLQMTS